MKEDSVMRLIHSFVISHVTYVAVFHNWTVTEREKLNTLIRKTYKIALGLPESTSTTRLLQLGVYNTLEEIADAQRVSQLERMSLTAMGRYILQKLGLNYHVQHVQQGAALQRPQAVAHATRSVQRRTPPAPMAEAAKAAPPTNDTATPAAAASLGCSQGRPAAVEVPSTSGLVGPKASSVEAKPAQRKHNPLERVPVALCGVVLLHDALSQDTRAAITILAHYRKYAARKYINDLKMAFRNVHQTKDYGKNVAWPPPPCCVREAVPGLKSIFSRWRGSMILRKVPREQWPQLHLKVTTADVLAGRRRDWGQSRKWHGNYLSLTAENDACLPYITSVTGLKSKDNFRKVVFSSFVKKVNRHNQSSDRALVVTDTCIIKMDNKKFKALRSPVPISDLTGISITPGPDQLAILHLRGNNDLVVCLVTSNTADSNRVGELVGAVVRQWQRSQKRDLRVMVGTQLQCMLGNKARTVSVESTSSVSQPTFKKAPNNALVLLWPKDRASA
ncbi:unconventional myosin ID-like [Rhipicephalus sanguineus]|uniref:unconventional myosin ID-like n=1 Tax=Rhipicephalus sanguineus TaxID=34632 RepID=UPI0020C3CD88|nr:unconventional myosin ID-like [Rhipicephalus sanguineus]